MARLLYRRDGLTLSNCYVLAEEGAALVIDPGHPRGAAELLERAGLNPEWILLTHEHCDHIAGLEGLRRGYPGARVAASGACSEGIQDARRNMSRMMEVYLTFRGAPGTAYPPFVCRPADQTFSRETVLHWRGHTLRATALPGHSPGSAVLLWDGWVLFSGDYLIPGEQVITRLPGGSRADYEETVRPRLAALPAGLWIFPGHGDPYFLTEEAKKDYGL